jgi:plastocyanin
MCAPLCVIAANYAFPGGNKHITFRVLLHRRRLNMNANVQWIRLSTAAITVGVFFGATNLAAPANEPGAPTSAAPTTAPAAKTATVEIDNFNFKPNELTVKVGATVTWTNHDDVPHTATVKGKSPLFDSKMLDTDEQFSFTFKSPGSYSYYCKVHPHMTATIVVK